jgi:hypothetical protein
MPAKRTQRERGYGYHHKQLRKRWAKIVNAGGVDCARCLQPILPSQRWDLDHEDDRNGYLGPSHVSCNRRGRRNPVTAKRLTSRDW